MADHEAPRGDPGSRAGPDPPPGPDHPPEPSAAAPTSALSGPSPALEDEALTYEQARDELAQVVRRMEAGGSTLEESLALWERGERLATICEEWLAGARERLEKAVRERADSGAGSDPRERADGREKAEGGDPRRQR